MTYNIAAGGRILHARQKDTADTVLVVAVLTSIIASLSSLPLLSQLHLVALRWLLLFVFFFSSPSGACRLRSSGKQLTH